MDNENNKQNKKTEFKDLTIMLKVGCVGGVITIISFTINFFIGFFGALI